MVELVEQAAAAVGQTLGSDFAGVRILQQARSDALAEWLDTEALQLSLRLVIAAAAQHRAAGEPVEAFVHVDQACAEIGILRACSERTEPEPSLFQARELAESAGARLLVRRGTSQPTVLLRLSPQAIDSAARARARDLGAHSGSQARLDQMHIVLVEDDPDALEFLSLILRHAGARVSSFGLAEPAFAFLTQPGADVDVIISDIAMPGEDGYSFMRRLRAWERSQRRTATPAVAVSAFAREEDARRALASGFDRHIAKPLDAGALIDLIACWSDPGR